MRKANELTLDLVEVDPVRGPMFNLEGSFSQDALQVLGSR
jgi:hypothetical protein